ncbi:TetR/AcrR family transcriptional regulator [Silvibacterium acidisoli]|uniref:TetR/AcrR family transcriptional regulator n=1 Tax=Acidobacteriaceae bacterium ZG23-2 TaxID=2883246 RepID=UPI00406D37A7
MSRTRVLDIDKAVHTAMNLFWRKGYDQTSLAELTAEMGVTPPSFYFAFASKDNLFRKVVDYYASNYLAFMNEALLKPTARKVAETILFGCVEAYTRSGMPPGCLIVNNSMPCADDALEIRRELSQARDVRFKQLRKRFRDAKAAGDLPIDSDPAELARYLMSLRWGMAIEAQSGATRRDLEKIAERALQAWPA